MPLTSASFYLSSIHQKRRSSRLETFANCVLLQRIMLPEALHTIRAKGIMNFAPYERWQYHHHTRTGPAVPPMPPPEEGIPQGCFHSSGIQCVTLLADANYVGHRAYENCKQLVKVDISLTTLKTLNMHTFSHCVSLIDICLPPTLQEIQAEAFKGCLALASIDLPDKLRYIAHKAFGDCGQLLHLRYRRDVRVTWRRPYAESNAFESCFRLDLPWWLNCLPPNGDDCTVPPSFQT